MRLHCGLVIGPMWRHLTNAACATPVGSKIAAASRSLPRHLAAVSMGESVRAVEGMDYLPFWVKDGVRLHMLAVVLFIY
uniref:Putative secreted protein n=1 Tax=Anopheles marajoara TaxID=58244 RepID=A0A2M4CC04_9DIPT